MVTSMTRLPATDAPFARKGYSGAAAIPKRPHQVGTAAPPRQQTLSPWAYRSALSGSKPERRGTFTGQCCRPLCSGDTTNHPASSLTNRNASGERNESSVLQQAKELGTLVQAETWHLPNCPCLAPPSAPIAGRRWLHSLPKGKIRARSSVRVRPRTGRIKPGQGPTAPFETKQTTPAAHA